LCGIQKVVHTRNAEGQEHVDKISENIGRVGSNGKPKDTCTTIMNTADSCEKSRERRPQPHTQHAWKVLEHVIIDEPAELDPLLSVHFGKSPDFSSIYKLQ
jgi:hypothetical protein